MSKETITLLQKKYIKQLGEVVKWDPEEEGLTPFVDIDLSKARKIVGEYLKEAGLAEKFVSKSGLTLHKTVSKFIFGDLILFMTGAVSDENLIAAMDRSNETNSDKYGFVLTPDKEMIKIYANAQRVINDVCQDRTVISSLGELTIPDGPSKTAIDALLRAEKLPSIEDILEVVGESEGKVSVAEKLHNTAVKEKEKADKEVERLSSELSDMAVKAMSTPAAEVEYEASGEIPEGKMVFKSVKELFPEVDLPRDFQVPCFEWEGEHPEVPKQDSHYIFRPESLIRVLYSIATNKRTYLQGHTGTGKTTLIEQVAARLFYPTIRVNMDSEITRMDLVGRDVLKTDEKGKTVSQFIDGILPKAMASAYILIVDEMDFVRPDVAYVMQSALEGNGLRITEDGDRMVKAHPYLRMFATGNTVGQGDEYGMYQGARPQSLALLDRFQVWAHIDYLTAQERADLVKRHYPMIKNEDRKVLCKYVTEHLAAFREATISQPISPRGMLAIAESFVVLGDMKESITMTTLDKANQEDRTTLAGIVQRVVK